MHRFTVIATLAAGLLAGVGCSHSGDSGPVGDAAAVSSAPVTAQLSTTAADYVAPTPAAQPETLPALPSDHTVYVRLALIDKTVEIAPEIEYRAWTFNGSVPGPVIHARVGDTIDVTLSNKAIMGHSIDFHAALAPPNVAYQTVQPGKTLHFSWVAKYPGAFLYHCGTPPVLAHISNGMYGAIIIDPPGGWGPTAREFVFVQSEFYPSLYPGTKNEYYGDLQKMRAGIPQVVTFNGVGMRYKKNPLPIKVGELVRVFVVDAGPSHFSAFHVIGTILKTVYADGNPQNKAVGLQTIAVPPGGGAVAEFQVLQAGTYPFVTHSFGDADDGAMGAFTATDQ
jgi:nitrite reductase (NO-forming)